MPSAATVLEPLLATLWGVRVATNVAKTLPPAAAREAGTLDVLDVVGLMMALEAGHRLFGTTGRPFPADSLRRAMTHSGLAQPHVRQLLIRSDADVLVTQRTCQAMTRGVFSVTEGVRVATAASELARNIYMYAGQGTMTLRLVEEATCYRLDIAADDDGPGIAELAAILGGQYHSRTGLGRGLLGTRALLEGVSIASAPGQGTHIRGHRRVNKLRATSRAHP